VYAWLNLPYSPAVVRFGMPTPHLLHVVSIGFARRYQSSSVSESRREPPHLIWPIVKIIVFVAKEHCRSGADYHLAANSVVVCDLVSARRFAPYRLNAAAAPTKRCNTFRRGHTKRRFILVAVVKRRFILRCHRAQPASPAVERVSAWGGRDLPDAGKRRLPCALSAWTLPISHSKLEHLIGQDYRVDLRCA
jgi:hypothetical protein